jgi:hypothetical protein
VTEEEAACVGAGGCAGIIVDTVAKHYLLCLSTSEFAAGSTISWWCLRKSTPIIGKETAASKNVHKNFLPWKDKSRVLSPQQGIGQPAAPRKDGPEAVAEEWCGKIE